MSQFWIALSYVGLGLEAALVLLLFKSGRREFPLFLAYTSSYVVASFALIFGYQLLRDPGSYAILYWSINIGLDCIAIAVIVDLIGRTLKEYPAFNWLARLGTFLVSIGVPVVIAHDQRLGYWITGILRDLSFAAEVLNVVLWIILTRKRDFETRLIWVSAGFGIQVTGQVLAHTLRMLSSKTAIWAPNLLLNLCELTALGIWLYAFSSNPAATRSFRMSSLKPGGFRGSPSRSATSFRD